MPRDPAPLIGNVPVIPVLTIERIENAVPLARALVLGGLRVLEVTLRTRAGLAAIEAIATAVPEAIVGVGTVTTVDEIPSAIDAGAKYLVSPGTPPALAQALAAATVPSIPGCSTVSDAMALAELGFSVLKFFPAQASGGTAWLRAVAAPFPSLRFCPTGGIDAGNAASYLALPNVIAVGGSWVAPKTAIDVGDFAGVTKLAQAASALRMNASGAA